MDKPEGIPQDVWDEAKTHLMQANTKGRMLGEPTDPLECISRAILSAQSQAYIDAARIAESKRIAWSSAEYFGGFNDACNGISTAILSRKDELGRN